MEQKFFSLKKNVDGLGKRKIRSLSCDLPLVDFLKKYKKRSEWLHPEGRREFFYTVDSKRYLTQAEREGLHFGGKIVRIVRRLDGVQGRTWENTRIYSLGRTDILWLRLKDRCVGVKHHFWEIFYGSMDGVSAVRLWNLSLVGAVLFGMFTMTMVYRYLGQGVSAKTKEGGNRFVNPKISQVISQKGGSVLGVSTENESSTVDLETFMEVLNNYETPAQDKFEKEIREMVKGYPIEKMAGDIAGKDRIVAAFMIAIAKKESDWGRHVPVLDGNDCYNYWGYRGIREKMGTGGHTCFNSRKDAVDTVAKRLATLINDEKLNTPEKIVVWKCGYDCSWDDQKAVNKWIQDVNLYFKKVSR